MVRRIAEFIRYGFWGMISVIINLLLFYIFVAVHCPYIIANIVSYILAVIFSYIVNNKYVFQGNRKNNDKIKKIKYFLMRGSSIFIDSLLLAFFYQICGFTLILSKIIDSVLIIISTYILSKYWIF